MIKKFVCKHGHHFEADDSKEVICPICLTKEYKEDTSSPLKTLCKKVCLVLGILVVLGGCLWGLSKLFNDDDITVGYENLEYDEQEGTYSFNATSNCLGKEEIEFELLAYDTDQVLKDNSDGQFTGVAPSVTEGMYKLRVFNESRTKSATITIDGFDEKKSLDLIIKDPVLNSSNKYDLTVSATDKSAVSAYILLELYSDVEVVSSVTGQFKNVEPSNQADSYRVIAKLKNGKHLGPIQISGFQEVSNQPTGNNGPIEIPTSEVQNWVNNDVDGTFTGGNKKIASNVTLHFIGLKSGDTSPKVLADVQNKIDMGIWSSVTVTDVDVDQRTGKVSSITFKVSY